MFDKDSFSTTITANSSTGDYQDDDDDNDHYDEEDDEDDKGHFDDNFQFDVCIDIELPIEINRQVGEFLLLHRGLIDLINGSTVLSFTLVLFIF